MKNSTRILVEKILVSALCIVFFLNGLLFVRELPISYVILFATGVVLGMVLLELDERFLYQYYQEPGKSKQLMTRSAVFLLSLFPMGVFLMTSTGSFLGVGMLLGILGGLSVELLAVRNNMPVFESRFMQQVQRPFTAVEQWWICVGFALLTALFATLISLTNR